MIYPTKSGVKICPTDAGTLLADSAADAARPLSLRDLAGAMLFQVAVAGEWALDRVVELLSCERACECVSEAFGADAYIGSHWIGSTEV